MKKIIAALAATLAMVAFGAGAGFAQTDVLTGKAAKKLLFSHKRSDFVVQPQDFMVDADVALLNLMADMTEFKSVLYYGAIAASPEDGLAHKATVATSNHHSPKAAEQAALTECDALRSGNAACVIVAQVLPRKYSEQSLSFSASATAAFKKTYLRGKDEKAMAISPNIGSYGLATGDGAAAAALEVCSKDGAKDCEIVVQD